MAGCARPSVKDANDRDLARSLADPGTRQGAIAIILASGNSKVRLLLSWSRNPPSEVDETELDVGLAQAFGQLRTKEAIPFLIKNINLKRFVGNDAWTRAPEVIEGWMPAVAALIQIGPESSKALIRAWDRMSPDDRLGAIFVVSRIKGVPEARAFLLSALGEANMQRRRAEEGLGFLDAQQ